MQDAYRGTILSGYTDQFLNLFSDEIRFQVMVNKYIPFGKRYLKKTSRWFAYGVGGCAAVDKK
jgi:hypothetical protein